MNNLKVVSELIEDYVQDIEDIESKEYLKTALVSHITTRSGLPRLYVLRVVKSYFDGFSC